MGIRANSTLMGRIATARSDLNTLALDLRNAGDKELSDAVARAAQELKQPVVTGAENTFGVNAHAFRK